MSIKDNRATVNSIRTGNFTSERGISVVAVGAVKAGPVRHLKPPTVSEPAEQSTIVAILLRKHYKLYAEHGNDEDKLYLCRMYFAVRKRKLTDEEAKKALALLTWYRARS